MYPEDNVDFTKTDEWTVSNFRFKYGLEWVTLTRTKYLHGGVSWTFPNGWFKKSDQNRIENRYQRILKLKRILK